MDKVNIQALYDERGKLVGEMRGLLEAAGDQPLSAEDQEKHDKMDARYDELTKQIRAWESQSAREDEESRLAEIKPAVRQAPVSEERQVKVARAWSNWLRTGREVFERELRDFASDSQNIGDNGDGGYLVPDEFERTLLKKIDDENVMRQVATVSQTSSGTLTIPYRESKPAAAAKDEKATYAIGNIEFLTTTIDVFKLTNSIAVTEEMLTDSAFDIESEITEALGETIGAAEEAWFVTGGGTTVPYGIVTGASAGVTAASASAITSDELIDLYHSLHKGYRARATWGFEDATAQVIRKLKDGEGQYMWQPGLQAGSPDRLLGRPVAYIEAMAGVGSGTVPVIFGDMSKYRIVDRAGLRIIRNPYTYSREGVVIFSVSKRVGGRLPLSEAVKKLTMGT